jgi:hypothetical protein
LLGSASRGRGGVAERSGGVAGIGRREVEDRADRWAPLGGDRGRRRHRRVTQCEKGNVFWPIRHCRACRDGPSARGLWERRPVAGCVERPGGPAGRRADWAESEGKILFRIKIGFLNLPRLWKFAQGDLGGILMWGFFLNSSRLLKDFRKI